MAHGILTEGQLRSISTGRLQKILRYHQTTVGYAHYHFLTKNEISEEEYNGILAYHQLIKDILAEREQAEVERKKKK